MNLRILVVESNPEDLLFLLDVLEEVDGAPEWTAWTQLTTAYASSWAEASSHLSSGSQHVVLLNPNLSDCHGVETFRRCQALAPQVPVVLLLDPGEMPLAEQLLREGAQDFLAKTEVDRAPLARTIGNAVNRHRLLIATQSVAMVDLLTGLLSRAAFLVLAERDLRLAERLGRRVIVVLAEPGPPNRPSSGVATQDRDLELVETAEQLRNLAGAMDLVARIGHNRLAVTILDTDRESAEEVWARMHTASTQRRISLGAAVFDPCRPNGLQDLLERAELDLAPTVALASVI